jgi:hypothetical protein
MRLFRVTKGAVVFSATAPTKLAVEEVGQVVQVLLLQATASLELVAWG